eukprot:4376708-Amphidinium_carterae.1
MVLLEAFFGKTAAAAATASSSPSSAVFLSSTPFLHGFVPPGDYGAAALESREALHLPWEQVSTTVSSVVSLHGSSVMQGLKEIAGGVTTAATALADHVSELQVYLGTGFAAAAGTGAIVTDCFGLFRDSEEDSDEEDDSFKRGSFIVVPAAMRICAGIDTFKGAVLLWSLGTPLQVPLKTWVLGGILLSYPITALIRTTSRRHGHRAAFVVEVAAVTAGFVWLSWGTVLLASNPDIVVVAPLLFWTCFTEAALAWSWLGASVGCMVSLTVLSVVAERGGKAPEK